MLRLALLIFFISLLVGIIFGVAEFGSMPGQAEITVGDMVVDRMRRAKLTHEPRCFELMQPTDMVGYYCVEYVPKK